MLKFIEEAIRHMGAKVYSTVDSKWHDIDDLPNSATGKVESSPQKTLGGWPVQSNGTVSTGYTYVKCDHVGEDVLWKWEGIEFCAAAKSDMDVVEDKTTLLINYSGYAANEKPKDPKPVVETVPEALKGLDLENLDYTVMEQPDYYGEELLVTWGDQKAPRLKAKWWKALLKALKGSPYKRVVVCCIGAHGRTGTALCALRLAMGLDKNTDESVDWVRKEHCEKAVESKEQIGYLDYLSKTWYDWDPPKEAKK